jgi:hypothetical protein
MAMGSPSFQMNETTTSLPLLLSWSIVDPLPLSMFSLILQTGHAKFSELMRTEPQVWLFDEVSHLACSMR